jgi:hypothetical protein
MFRVAVTAALLAATLGATASTAQSGREKAAARQEAQLARSLAGLTPGTPEHCIDPRRVTYTENYPDTILYVAGRGELWRTDTVGTCAGLKNDDIVVARRISGHICEGDIIETRARAGGFYTGSCSLGKLVPYTK